MTSTLTVDDPSSLLFNQQATATVGPGTDQGQTVNWTFSLGGTLPTDHLKFMTSTHAERNASYVHPELTTIDRSVSVVLEQRPQPMSPARAMKPLKRARSCRGTPP